MLTPLLASLFLLPGPLHAGASADTPTRAPVAAVETHLGGFVQPRLTRLPTDETLPESGELGFSVRRARLEVKSTVDLPRDAALRQKVSIELMSEPRLVDVFVEAGPTDALQLRLGQFKTPTSRSVLVSDRRTLFPERSIVTDETPRRDIGAQLHGELGSHHVEWAAGVFNGEGTNQTENLDQDLLTAWRLVLSPFGGPGTSAELLPADAPATLSLGLSGYRNTTHDGDTTHAVVAHTLEGFAHMGGLTIQAEWLHARVTSSNAGTPAHQVAGGYVQAGLFVPRIPWACDHLALLGKLEQLDPHIPPTGPVPFAAALEDNHARRQIAVGLGYYVGAPTFDSIHTLRVQLTYGMWTELETRPVDNDQLQLAVHMSF